MDGEKIWEKREDESAKAFNAFCIYRDMPPFERSLENTRKKLGREIGYRRYLETWSSNHDWVKRAGAWDAYRDQQTEQRRIEEWKEFQENIADYAYNLLNRGAQRIQEIKSEDIPAVVLSKWLSDALKAMRDIRGEPSEIIEHRVKGYTNVSPDNWDGDTNDRD